MFSIYGNFSSLNVLSNHLLITVISNNLEYIENFITILNPCKPDSEENTYVKL